MRASLILCTKNGGERLANCLSHIEALDAGPDFQVVLVDNNSDDGVSWPALQEYGRTTRHDCAVIRCTRPGNSAGRNDGIAVATGEILLFIDDDCYVLQDFVNQWRDVFTRFNIGYGTGMVLRHDPEMSGIGCKESPETEMVRAGQLVEAGFVQGSNMAFRRDCLDRIGLFDERFGTGVPFAGEDWDMGLRASFGGFAGGYFPEPKVSHDHRRPISGIVESRLHFYTYGTGAVCAKHMRGRNFPALGITFLRHVRRLLRQKRGKELLASFLKGWRDYRRVAAQDKKRAVAGAVAG